MDDGSCKRSTDDKVKLIVKQEASPCDNNIKDSIHDESLAAWYEQNDDGVVDCVNVVSDENVTVMSEQQRRRMKQVQHNDFEWGDQQLRAAGLCSGGTGHRRPTILKGDQSHVSMINDQRSRRHELVFKGVRPAFLENKKILNNSNNNLKEQGVVSIFRDSGGDLANACRVGSRLALQAHSDQLRSAFRTQFWKINESAVGKLIAQKPNVTGTVKDKTNVDDSVTDTQNDSTRFGALLTQQQRLTTDNITDKSKMVAFGEQPSLAQQRRALPVYGSKDSFLRAVRENQVLIVRGQTGSGKTTQLAQYLVEAGMATADQMVACTQPRRVAAVSVAARVAEEMGVQLGEEVGYAIRFEDMTTKNVTKVKFMTEGILLRETVTDRLLLKYGCIIMDEAHERSLNTDVLFGVLRNILSERSDLRVIITSATLEFDKFASFFPSSVTFDIPGRTYPVDTFFLKNIPEDYVQSAVQKTMELHTRLSPDEQGDILIFMTGQDDVEACALALQMATQQAHEAHECDPLAVLPIYSMLASELQAKVFAPSVYRKCIVATNIAETSLTIPGIKYVIDCGLCKVKVYSPKVGMDVLSLAPISQANAAQRAGRAGRTQPGECYRLFSEHAFLTEMYQSAIPEIQRTNLANVVLLLCSLDIDVLKFAFLDPPPTESLTAALYQLYVLEALDATGALTPLGKEMASIPLEPSLSRCLLFSVAFQCTDDVSLIVAGLSSPPMYAKPTNSNRSTNSANGTHETIDNNSDEALVLKMESARGKYVVFDSDHLTMLNILKHCLQQKSSRDLSAVCKDLFLHSKVVQKIIQLFQQIKSIVTDKYPKNTNSVTEKISTGQEPSNYFLHNERIKQAVCAGFFPNAAKRKGFGSTTGTQHNNQNQNANTGNNFVVMRNGLPCSIHPSSSLFANGCDAEFVVFHELLVTVKNTQKDNTNTNTRSSQQSHQHQQQQQQQQQQRRQYMMNVTAVDPEWIATVGSSLFALKQSTTMHNQDATTVDPIHAAIERYKQQMMQMTQQAAEYQKHKHISQKSLSYEGLNQIVVNGNHIHAKADESNNTLAASQATIVEGCNDHTKIKNSFAASFGFTSTGVIQHDECEPPLKKDNQINHVRKTNPTPDAQGHTTTSQVKICVQPSKLSFSALLVDEEEEED